MANQPNPTTGPAPSPGSTKEQEAATLPGPSEGVTGASTSDGEDEDGTTLRVVAPSYITEFVIPAVKQDGKEVEPEVRIGQSAQEVPADKVSEYIKRAKDSGVTLSRKKG